MAACWLVWHAVRAEPDPVEGEEVTDDGHEGDRFRRDPRPRSARRGPAAARMLPTRRRSPVPRTAASGFSRWPALPAVATGSARERG